MKRSVTVHKTWDIEIDILDDNIKDIMEGYNGIIDSHGDIEDAIEHMAYNYCINESKKFIEGIGDLNEVGVTVEMLNTDVCINVYDED